MKGTLHCDGCGHEEEVSNLMEHTDTRCPSCHVPYMNEKDKEVLKMIGELADMGLAWQSDGDLEPGQAIVHINTGDITNPIELLDMNLGR